MNRFPGEMAPMAARIRRRRSAGFSMVEILLASMILSIGFIMLLPAFTVALNESRLSVESSIVVQLGQNAEAICHTKLDTQHDGNFSDAHVNDMLIHPYLFRDTPSGSPANALAGFTTWRARDNYQSVYTTPPGDDDQVWVDGAGNKWDSHYERSNDRIYGDPKTSKYYWTMLYRFPPIRSQAAADGTITGTPSRTLVEIWIMVCRRQQTGNSLSNTIVGLRPATLIPLPGQVPAGANTFDAGDQANFLDPGSGMVAYNSTSSGGSVADQGGEILRVAGRDGTTIKLTSPAQRNFDSVFLVKYADSATAENACISVLHTMAGF